MGYLLPAEYAEYGLPEGTTDDWVAMASALMESYCRRVSLMATEYVERMRLTAGSQAVRLSYLPLVAVAPATNALVCVNVRYATPRRGELEDPMLSQVAWAFSVPGSWSALDPASVDVDCVTGNVTFPRTFLGLGYNEVEVKYTAGLVVLPAHSSQSARTRSSPRMRGEDRVRADCEECAGNTGAECEIEQARHDADAVLQQRADRSAGAGAAAAVSGAKDRVTRWRTEVRLR
jgi:hypothetical protein